MVPKLPVIACLILCALALTACSAGQPPPPLAQLSATLASLPDISGQDGVGSDPSRGARPALTMAKHQLRDWIEAELTGGAYGNAPNIDANGFAALVNGKLKAAGIRTRPVKMWSEGGVLIAVTSFDIVCGADDSIYGWSWDGKAWRRVIAHEITDYAPDRYKPEAIFGPENVRFAPADPNGAKLHILITALNTWCTSGWQDRRFQLYDLDRQVGNAALLVDGEVPAFTNEGDQNASLTADRMVIEYTGDDLEPRKIPFGIRARVLCPGRRQSHAGPLGGRRFGGFHRAMGGSALDAEFLRQRTGHAGARTLADRLHGLSARADNSEWTSFADAVRCGDHSDIWEYAIVFGTPRPAADLVAAGPATICRHMEGERPNSCTIMEAPGQLERAKLDFTHPSTAYFIVQEIAPNQFSMTDIRSTPRPGCPKMGA